MKLIVGLGNPGRQYQGTRHNIGFDVVARLMQLNVGTTPTNKFSGEVSEIRLGGHKTLLLCPQTYMNASGKSVRKATDFYKTDLEDLLVICDDMNLPRGRIRVRPNGSAGGQKGLADIIRHLGSDNWPRMRLGIDRPPPGWEVTDYVLGKFNDEECQTMQPTVERACQACACWAEHGMPETMSQFNGAAESSA